MATESKWRRIWNRAKALYEIRPPEGVESPSILKLRAIFENREAIYIEKGALKVRVSNIRGSALHTTVSADIEEVPTPGLGVGLFDRRQRKGKTPLRWGIGAGHLTKFSDHCWVMGYGGWTLYFDPKVVQGVLDLASGFPDNMDTFERYNKIVRFVPYDPTLLQTNWQDVFRDT